MDAPTASPVSPPSAPAERVLPSAELAMARLGALNPNLKGCAIFTVTGDLLASHGEPLVRESAGRKFWLEKTEPEVSETVTKHACIPGGEFFGVRVAGLAMLALADPGTLPSLTLLDMQTILGDLARNGAGNSTPGNSASGTAGGAI